MHTGPWARGGFYEPSMFDCWGTEAFNTTWSGMGWVRTVDGEEPKCDIYSRKLRAKSSGND